MHAGRLLLVLAVLWAGAARASDFPTLPDYLRVMAALGTPEQRAAFDFFAIDEVFDIARCEPSINSPMTAFHLYHLDATRKALQFRRRMLFPLGTAFTRTAAGAAGISLPEYTVHLQQAINAVTPQINRDSELVRWYAIARDMRQMFARTTCQDAIENQAAFINAVDEFKRRFDTFRKWIELEMAARTNRPRYGDTTDLVPTEFVRIPQSVITRATLSSFLSSNQVTTNHRQALAQSRGQLLIRIHPNNQLLDVMRMTASLAAVEIPFSIRRSENSGEVDLEAGQFTVYYFERHTEVILTFDELPRLINFARRFAEVWRQSLLRRN
jgi:hypothetical protein